MINYWQTWTIALACACVCLFVATGLALWLMYRYKAQNERLHENYGACILSRDSFEMEVDYAGKEIVDLTKQAERLIDDKVALQIQVEQYGKDAIAQAKRVDRALQERDTLEAANGEMGLANDMLTIERDKLKAQLDGQAQPETAPKKRTKKTDTATMLSQE